MPIGWNVGGSRLPDVEYYLIQNEQNNTVELRTENGTIVDTESGGAVGQYITTPEDNVLTRDRIYEIDYDAGAMNVEFLDDLADGFFDMVLPVEFTSDGQYLVELGPNDIVNTYEWPSLNQVANISVDLSVIGESPESSGHIYDKEIYYSNFDGDFKSVNVLDGTKTTITTALGNELDQGSAHPYGYAFYHTNRNTPSVIYDIKNDSITTKTIDEPINTPFIAYPNGWIFPGGSVDFNGNISNPNKSFKFAPSFGALLGVAYSGEIDLNGNATVFDSNNTLIPHFFDADQKFSTIAIPKTSSMWTDYGTAEYMDKLAEEFDL